MKLFLKLLLIVLSLYLLMLAGFFGLMLLPPARFAKAVSQVPEPMFAILPLERLPISDHDRAKVAHTNADSLLRL